MDLMMRFGVIDEGSGQAVWGFQRQDGNLTHFGPAGWLTNDWKRDTAGAAAAEATGDDITVGFWLG